jgi:hypothetical protein
VGLSFISLLSLGSSLLVSLRYGRGAGFPGRSVTV